MNDVNVEVEAEKWRNVDQWENDEGICVRDCSWTNNIMNKTTRKISNGHTAKASENLTIDDDLKMSLQRVDFDVWKYTEDQLILLFEQMFHDLDLFDELRISRSTLENFLTRVQSSYRSNPFHNFRHCFCVTQMMYVFIHGCELSKIFSKRELAVLLVSCICHDLDHPGLSNSYQINAKTELAKRYEGKSPLENHHRDVAFRILAAPETNLFAGYSSEEEASAKNDVATMILSTDMSCHNEIMSEFKKRTESEFDFDSPAHLLTLKCILIKACDVSNECRPILVSEAWASCLLQEYFEQSDKEKACGLPYAPFMDREKVTVAGSQIGFIEFVLIPLFESLKELFPAIETIALSNLRKSLEHYCVMAKNEESPEK